MNKFTHSRSSLDKHTRFETKMRKVYTRFQTKTSQKPSPMAYTRESPPPPGRVLSARSKGLRLDES